MEPPKLKELVNELNGVRAKWRAIGRQLEVSSGTLDSIGCAHKNDSDQGEALAKMLEECLKRTDLSWLDIVEALRAASVDEHNTARRLERIKCPRRNTPCDYPASPGAAADHRRDEVPALVREAVAHLAGQFNNLRIKAHRHITALEKAHKVTANEFRFVICNPQRNWQGDDHQRVFMADCITEIFSVLSVKRHLNWQNYTLLKEIIEEFGDINLKTDLETYRHKLDAFESKTPLLDVKHIIFTPRGPNQGLMKVPMDNISDPTLHTARCIQNGLHKNGFPTALHHVGQNSPLALYFIVPRHLMPPTFKHPIDSTAVEDHVVCTLSNDDVRQLLDLPAPVSSDSLTPSDDVDSESVFRHGSITSVASLLEKERFPSPCDLHVFSDQVINNGDTAVICKAQFFHLPCAAKYIHCSLSDSSHGHIDNFKKGCEILQSCCHPNIITALSAYSDTRLGYVMLMELMDKSLKEFLQDQKAHLPLHVQLNICSDVAHGLEYLHAKKIIHGSLTASNVLLRNDRAKICGVVSLQHNTPDCELSLCPGVPGSLPRRSFSVPDYSYDIDSFSFGVLAMHIATLETPQPYPLPQEEGSEMDRYERSLEKIATKHPLQQTIINCLSDTGNLRPTATQLCVDFSEMQRSSWYCSSQSNQSVPIRQLALEKENKDLQRKLETKQADIERLWLFKKQVEQQQLTAQRKEEELVNRIAILAVQNNDLNEKMDEVTKQLSGAKKGRDDLVTEKDRICRELWKERERVDVRDSKIKELEKEKATIKTQLESADSRVAELMENA